MIIPAQEPDIPLNLATVPLISLQHLAEDSSSDSTGGWSSIIGIVTAIIGNILISFALNTQRLAHIRLEKEQNKKSSQSAEEEDTDNDYGAIQNRIAEDRAQKNAQSARDEAGREEDEHEDAHESDALIPKMARKLKMNSTSEGETGDNQESRKSYLRSPLWWIGITLMTVGEAGNFLAYGFAPASIVSPLGVVAIVSNCIIAPVFLHETFRKRDLLGVIVAVGGTVTIVLSAQGSNPKLGPDEILELIKRWEFLLYLGITILLIIVLMFLSNRFGDRTILIDLGLVGLFGGYTALSTKGVASLLSYRLWRTLTFPITYLLVAILVVTAILQIKYVNRALQRFDSTRVIPTQFVLFTIFVIVGSAVLYRDFESATPESGGKFVGGCCLTFLGVWLLTSGRRDDDDDQPEESEFKLGMKRAAGDPDEEHHIALTDDEATPPATPKRKNTPSRSVTGTSMSTTSFTSAFSQQTPASSSSRPGTQSSSSRIQHAVSTSAVPTLLAERQISGETPSGGKKAPPLASRPSLSQLFAPSSFSPLTTPLSGGLSVVVADQRGRLARGGSLRASVGNAAAFAANSQIDGGGSQRQSISRGMSVASGRSGAGHGEGQSRSRERDQASTGGFEAVIDERPRVGRGATVEVVSATEGLGGEGRR